MKRKTVKLSPYLRQIAKRDTQLLARLKKAKAPPKNAIITFLEADDFIRNLVMDCAIGNFLAAMFQDEALVRKSYPLECEGHTITADQWFQAAKDLDAAFIARMAQVQGARKGVDL